MTNIAQHPTADRADFLAGVRTMIERGFVAFTVIGLTNFGEYPVQSTRLAAILGKPVREAEALAQQWSIPGTRVEAGFISVDPERAQAAPRRHVRIGQRQFGVSGCAPDVFGYAPLVRPSLQLEEICSTTGTPIRLEFPATVSCASNPPARSCRSSARSGSTRPRGCLWRSSTPMCAFRRRSSPPPRRRKDGWRLIPAAASSRSGRRGT